VKILVVYHSHAYPVRSTIRDHLRSFARYSNHSVYHLNAANPVLPRSVHSFRPDLVIFHTTFLSDRTAPEHFERLLQRVGFLRESSAIKIALPQDEYVATDALSRFIDDFGVSRVFSCAQPGEWPKIYRDVDPTRGVVYRTVLTGYLSDATLGRILKRAAHKGSRAIDIGYRAWYPWPSLGRHGQMKGLIGEVFENAAQRAGLRADISTSLDDTILGDAWFDFLLACKYTIGVEGGASILDRDGSIADCTRTYLDSHPEATFEEVERECFPGRDGDLNYFALSPRHLECCATRTCQILVEGEYNGVLLPWVHYIPVRRDLSNIAEIVEVIVRDEGRAEMTDRAFTDVVLSGKWSYAGLVRTVLAEAEAGAGEGSQRAGTRLTLIRGAAWDGVWTMRRAAKYHARRFAAAILGEQSLLRAMRRIRDAVRR
jgi:hypothetical protein